MIKSDGLFSVAQSSSCPRIGVIGGGQLAWMLGQAAQGMGLEFWVQAPDSNTPAVVIATGHIPAAVDDSEATARLAQHCDVITFENEFVQLPQLQTLADQGVQFAPRLQNLAPLLDKYEQRCYLQKIGLPNPGFQVLQRKASGELDLPWGFPVVLKARRQGYDGLGTHILKDWADLEAVLEGQVLEAFLLEEFVPFQRELAVMVARSAGGEVVVYPVVETYQENQVCHHVRVPAPISEPIQRSLQDMARTFVESLEGVGIFGLEFFLDQNDRVLVNEVAPRTHNSGHYSLDACNVSQFEQQLRAIANLALKPPELNCTSAVMFNLLGFESSTQDYRRQRQQLAEIPNSFLYWYGKTQSRPGRKLGHLTIIAEERTPFDALPLDIEALNHTITKIWQQDL